MIVPRPRCQMNKTISIAAATARKTGGIKLCSAFYFACALTFEKYAWESVWFVGWGALYILG